MTRTELDKFSAILNAKKLEASRTLGRREGLAIERTADALDEVQFAATRELTTRHLEREAGLLRDVQAALDRMTNGSFGVCLQCEEEISQKRLKAVPWATLCIACQEESDRDRQSEVGHERLLRAA